LGAVLCFALFAVVPLTAHAQTVNLTCTQIGGNAPTSARLFVIVDLSANTAAISGVDRDQAQSKAATITDSTVTWDNDDGQWRIHYVLDRSSGQLTETGKNLGGGKSPAPRNYSCTKDTKVF
jgi:hypothetical protein